MPLSLTHCWWPILSHNTASLVLQTLYPDNWPLTTLIRGTLSQARVTLTSLLPSQSRITLLWAKPSWVRCKPVGYNWVGSYMWLPGWNNSCSTTACFYSVSLYSCTHKATIETCQNCQKKWLYVTTDHSLMWPSDSCQQTAWSVCIAVRYASTRCCFCCCCCVVSLKPKTVLCSIYPLCCILSKENPQLHGLFSLLYTKHHHTTAA